ncbi:MAG: M20/M25/M40 family metallo-hydrolase [Chloroflexota bacterium]
MTARKTLSILVTLCSLLTPLGVSSAQEMPDFVAQIETEDVMAHVRALSEAIGARPMGSAAEGLAANYVAAALSDWGYEVTVEEFDATAPAEEEDAPGTPIVSRNVIGVRPGDDKLVVVGAHVDSVTAGTGAGDNASGVAVMLATARALADLDTTHTLVFIAFGAEEGGDPPGAEVYVEGLGDAASNIIAMINIDSVGVGTALNVYAGAVITWPEDESTAPTIEGGPVWVRDLALDLAAEMSLPFDTSPADTWGGFTGDWSDHYAFVLAGVPVAYFEAWQWVGAEDPWRGQETAEGDVMHSEGDVYAAVVPEKVEMTAEVVAATTYAIATGMAGTQ